MGLTNFPDGISVNGTAVAGLNITRGSLAGTVGGTVATGLGTVLGCQASLETIGTGSAFVAIKPSGGSVIITVWNSSAAAATVGGTVHWLAAGS